jgi:hypothetical protein
VVSGTEKKKLLVSAGVNGSPLLFRPNRKKKQVGKRGKRREQEKCLLENDSEIQRNENMKDRRRKGGRKRALLHTKSDTEFARRIVELVMNVCPSVLLFACNNSIFMKFHTG